METILKFLQEEKYEDCERELKCHLDDPIWFCDVADHLFNEGYQNYAESVLMAAISYGKIVAVDCLLELFKGNIKLLFVNLDSLGDDLPESICTYAHTLIK